MRIKSGICLAGRKIFVSVGDPDFSESRTVFAEEMNWRSAYSSDALVLENSNLSNLPSIKRFTVGRYQCSPAEDPKQAEVDKAEPSWKWKLWLRLHGKAGQRRTSHAGTSRYDCEKTSGHRSRL